MQHRIKLAHALTASSLIAIAIAGCTTEGKAPASKSSASVSIEHGAQVEGRLVRLSRESTATNKDVVVPLAGARAANDGASNTG